MKVSLATCGTVLVLAMGCDEVEPAATDESTPVVDAGRDAASSGDAAVGGGQGSGATQPARSALFPVGFVLTSPTAMARLSINKGIDPAAVVTRDERHGQLALLLAGTKLSDCGVLLGSLLVGQGDNVSCYGPELDYKGHPDAMGGSADGRLPGGDLGLWKETEADGQACAAAKLNALIDKLSRRVDFGLYTAASAVCTGRVTGVLGANGDAGTGLKVGELDLTTSLRTALAANANLSVERAILERLADRGAAEVYHYEMDIAFTGPMGTRTVHTEIRHESDPDSTGSYTGRIWGTVSEAMRTDAYSVGYDRSEATGRLRYHAVGASFDMTPVNVFDATGHFKLGSNWSGNIAQGIFDMDAASTTTGNASFAWQAGSGDSHARVFNVFTGGAPTALEGCGFFGYGPRFDRSASALPDNSISTFICNWAGPSNNHTGMPGYAQKQCMQQSGSGLFEPTESAISYAPVNACSATSSFSYKLPSETSYTNTPLTSALVKLSTDADFAMYRAPLALP